MSSYLSVDRIENGIAACELDDRTMRMIPVSILPPDVREGDVLYERGGRYVADKAETMRRRDENIRLMKLLRKDDDETGFVIKKPEA